MFGETDCAWAGVMGDVQFAVKKALNKQRRESRLYLLARSGNTRTQTTLSPTAITAFEKSHARHGAQAPCGDNNGVATRAFSQLFGRFRIAFQETRRYRKTIG
jgi:hypothetical protein